MNTCFSMVFLIMETDRLPDTNKVSWLAQLLSVQVGRSVDLWPLHRNDAALHAVCCGGATFLLAKISQINFAPSPLCLDLLQRNSPNCSFTPHYTRNVARGDVKREGAVTSPILPAFICAQYSTPSVYTRRSILPQKSSTLIGRD